MPSHLLEELCRSCQRTIPSIQNVISGPLRSPLGVTTAFANTAGAQIPRASPLTADGCNPMLGIVAERAFGYMVT